MTQIIPVAEWKPDMPDLSAATSIANNVVPATSESYGPFNSVAAYSSNVLDGPCIGATASQAPDLTIQIFAGTTDKLYEITGSTNAWVDVSGSAYTTAPGDNWYFHQFAGEVIATNYAQTPQLFTPGVSTVFGPLMTAPAWAQSTLYNTLGVQRLANGNRYTLVGTGTSASSGTGPSTTVAGIADGTAVWDYQSGPPPNARYLATPKNFLMLGNTSDPIGGLGPQRVWWSINGDATSFPAPGSNAAIQGMSDFNDFRGDLGQITGLVDSLAYADAAIFFRHAVWRGLFVGPPDVFDFFPAENVRGCPCPNSIVPLGSLVYYRGEDGFYSFDGNTSTPIGADKFDRWFLANVNQAYPQNVIGAPDVVNRAIVWIFPSLYSGDGTPDTGLIYRWDIQRAAMITFGPGVVAWVMRLLSLGVTLDGFAALGFNDLDTIPASLDSSAWIGGALQLGAVDGAGHLAFFNGPVMAAQVGTNTVQLTPGRRSFVQSARPLVQITAGVPSIAVAGRVNLYDPEVFGTAVPPDVSGECPQRVDARYHDAMVTIPAGSAWTHIGGVELSYVASGTR